MAQISESCAFLLGNESESPSEIERKVKHLYRVRSSVVHSGKDFCFSLLSVLVSSVVLFWLFRMLFSTVFLFAL